MNVLRDVTAVTKMQRALIISDHSLALVILVSLEMEPNAKTLTSAKGKTIAMKMLLVQILLAHTTALVMKDLQAMEQTVKI